MKRIQGLSLIEVLVGLAIVFLLFAVAIPALGAVADRARIVRVQADLGEAFMTAARQAVAGGRATVLCASSDGVRCSGGTDWSTGWLSFADVDGDRQFSAFDTLIRRTPPWSGLRLSSTQGRPRIVFQPEGDSAGTNATFTICAPRSGMAGSLVLSNGGRFRLVPTHTDRQTLCASN